MASGASWTPGALYRHQGAAAAIAAAVMEAALTREFGVAWVQRADGHGREIAGISQAMMDAFSSRRQTITELAQQLAAEREREHGRRPDARQMYHIQKDIAYRTRQRKPESPLDIRAKLREWEATARARDLGELSAIPAAVTEAAQQAREASNSRRSGGWRGRSRGSWPAQRGSAADRAEFARIERFASFVTRRGADPRPVDPALLLRAWQAQERRDVQAQYELRREIARARRSGSRA